MNLELHRCKLCGQLFVLAQPFMLQSHGVQMTARHIGCPQTLMVAMTGPRGFFGLSDVSKIDWPELSPVKIEPTVSRVGDGWTIEIELKEAE